MQKSGYPGYRQPLLTSNCLAYCVSTNVFSVTTPTDLGFVTVFFSRVTAVCASIIPFIDAPVSILIAVPPSIVPSK
jgi:hypothetical protein